MSLNTRILTLASMLTLIAALASWLAYRELSRDIMERWGQEVAEIQVRYDSARLLQSLEREIGLARQMADSLAIQQWADNPDDPALQATAIRQMESFRNNFRDNTYFVALRKNLHYYFNNADNEFDGDQFRYQLDPAKAEDAWFFRLIEEGRDFHLNVNPDTELGVTKLWIDVLIRGNGRDVLGMVGTGLDLDAFLRDIVDVGKDGITTLFVDFNGAIQLYRDRNYIDFASIIKPEGQKNTIDLLFEAEDDKQKMLGMLQMLKNRGGEEGAIASSFVTIDGRRHLAGVAYLPAIGWFEITLLDLDTLIPPSFFWPLVAVFLITLLLTLVLFHGLVRRWVLKPVVALEQAVNQIREGNFALHELPKPDNEIGQLSAHFEDMASTLRSSTENLQEQVSQRTDELHRLARVDALTGLGNRRALDEALATELERARRQNSGFGILWLDVDQFKAINDERGHQTGDAILCDVAHWLKACLRPYDIAGRWGGDEFVVLLSPCDLQTLEHTAQRIRVNIESQGKALGLPVSVSIGGHLAGAHENLDDLLKQADQALYQAKQNGRNQVRISSEQSSTCA
ncbi:diguanylate cyclase domain-containing protein [Marinobacter mobilis]|uniref:diguanylate cyclase domain-containing protein n=1 Tax=Marinobacter mobilis TaxID=488533 RepID=UPI0035C6C382